VLPLWAEKFSLGVLMSGFLPTLLTISVAVGSILGGKLADRLGHTKMFQWNILFIALGTLFIALGQNLIFIIAGIVIAGISSGADLPTSLSVISDYVQNDEKGKAISTTQLFWTLGILLSQFFGLVTVPLGYASSEVMFCVLSVVSFMTFWIRRFSKKFNNLIMEFEESVVSEVKETSSKIRFTDLFRNKPVLRVFVTLTLFYVAWNIPANTWGTFENYFLVVVGGKSQSYATSLALIANILGFALNIWYLKMVDTRYRNRLMYIGVGTAFCSFTLAAMFGGQWIVFSIIYVLFSLSTVLVGEPLYKIWSQSLYPQNQRASLMGISYGIVRTITAIFSLFTPMIMKASPTILMLMFVVLTVVYGLAARRAVFLYKK